MYVLPGRGFSINGWWPTGARLIAREPRVAEHLQPVRMRLARQQFGRALTNPLRMLAAQEAAVIEKELQQDQVIRPQLAAEKKVVAQSASMGSFSLECPSPKSSKCTTTHLSAYRCLSFRAGCRNPPSRQP